MRDQTHAAFRCDLFLQVRERLINAAAMGVLRKQATERGDGWHVAVKDPPLKLRFDGAPTLTLLGQDRVRIEAPCVDFEGSIPVEGPVLTRSIPASGSVKGTVEGRLVLSTAGQRLELEVMGLVVNQVEILELKVGDTERSGPIALVRDALVGQLTAIVNRMTGRRMPFPLGTHELLDTALTDQPIDPESLRLSLIEGYLLAWGVANGPTPETMTPVPTEEDLLLHLSEKMIQEPVQSSVDESIAEREDAIFSERYKLVVERMRSKLVEGGLHLEGEAALVGTRREDEGPRAEAYYPPIRAKVNTYLYEYQGIDPENNEIVLLNTTTDYDLNKDDLKAFVIAGLKSSGRTWGADPKWRYFPPIGILIGIFLLIYDIKAFGKNSKPDTFTYRPGIEDLMEGVGLPLQELVIKPDGVTLYGRMRLTQSHAGPTPIRPAPAAPPLPPPPPGALAL